MSEMNRREFISKALAAGTVAASGSWAKAEGAQGDIPPILKKFEFTDQRGEPLDIEQLKKELTGKYTTVSFGFAECKAVCPNVNHSLVMLANEHPGKIKHIVVSTSEKNNANNITRDHFKNTICRISTKPGDRITKPEDGTINPKDVIVLYPKDYGLKDDMQRLYEPKKTFPERTPGHTSTIFLHDPNGRLIGNSNGNVVDATPVLEAFSNQLRGRGRG